MAAQASTALEIVQSNLSPIYVTCLPDSTPGNWKVVVGFEGFSVTVDYQLEKCRAVNAAQVHFVTHSLGGILLRYAHDRSPITNLGRVVMLAPPNQGSELVDKLKNWPGAKLFSGPAGAQLGTGEDSIPSQLGPVDFELGIVAGTGTISLMSAWLPDPDDGKVTVEGTKVEGMDDFLVVDDSHRYIVTAIKSSRIRRCF